MTPSTGSGGNLPSPRPRVQHFVPDPEFYGAVRALILAAFTYGVPLDEKHVWTLLKFNSETHAEMKGYQ